MSATTSTTQKTPAFQKKLWATQDEPTQAWVNEVIWRVLQAPQVQGEAFKKNTLVPNAVNVLAQALQYHRLSGVASVVYGKSICDVLGADYQKKFEQDVAKTEIFLRELKWIYGPKLSSRVVPIGAFAARNLYKDMKMVLPPNTDQQATLVPRLSNVLRIWTPTLANREELAELLQHVGYKPLKDSEDGYPYQKITLGLTHNILMRGILWESSKNWTNVLEREMLDRAIDADMAGTKRFESTDLMIMLCRSYAIDTVLGGAAELLDLFLALDQLVIDWDRIRQIKNMFTKPDWFWAAMCAVVLAEKHISRQFNLPEWVREGVYEMNNTFWPAFILSRMNWANPDTKFIDYSRAYVKMAKGT